jgi:hypothetical protein
VRGRTGDRVRGLAGLLVLVALVAGPPVALSMLVGWPLPRSIPSLDEIDTALRTGVDDVVVVKVLAVLAWLVWAQIAVAVVAAVAARARGRRPRRVAIPLVQVAVGRLVATAALAFSGLGTAHQPPRLVSLANVAAPPVVSTGTAAAGVDLPERAGQAAGVVSDTPTRARAPAGVYVATDTDDTWWGAAESALGDGARWRELRDANVGRRMSDGTVIGPTTESISAGWELWLPAGAPIPIGGTLPAGETPVDSRFAADEFEIPPGGHFWSASEDRLAEALGRPPTDAETAPYWRETVEENRDVLVDPGNPNLLYPGQLIVRPAVPGVLTPPGAPAARVDTAPTPLASVPDAQEVTAPAAGPDDGVARGVDHAPDTRGTPRPTMPDAGPPGAAPEVPATRQRPAPVEAPEGRGTDDQPDPDRAETTSEWGVRAGLVGATALATWAMFAARARRDRRLRGSRAGQVFPPPDPTVEPMAEAVRANARPAAVDRLVAALRHLATGHDAGEGTRQWRSALRERAGARRQREGAPRPQVVLRHPNDDIEVVVVEPTEHGFGPWEVRADGRIWALPHDAMLPANDGPESPCPALVQLGVTDDGAELYADLEGLGTLGLDGPSEAVRQIARALTATLALSPAAQSCRVLTYGFDPYGLDEQVHPRLGVFPSTASLLDEAEGTARPVAAAVDAEGVGSTFRLRALVPAEGWEPAIVVVGGTVSEEEQARLTVLGGSGGRGAAVVTPGSASSRWVLATAEQPGWWRLDPLGLRVRPVGVAAEELGELAAYLGQADAAPVTMQALREPEVRDPAAGAAAPSLQPPAFHEPDWLVMVRLLGSVDVVDRSGAAEPVERSQPVELLAWLATHRGSATRAKAVNALWSGRAVDVRSTRNVVSAARMLLRSLAGEPPEGDWIPLRQERLDLHPLVVTDVDLVRARLDFARRADPDEAAAVLAEGLPLLRGVPFEDRQWLWADEDYVASSVAADAASFAHLLATLRLEMGDVRGALAATEAGLRIIPLHDQLTELSMQALVAGGDRRSALAVYEAYERAVVARGEAVADEVALLRNELVRATTAYN